MKGKLIESRKRKLPKYDLESNNGSFWKLEMLLESEKVKRKLPDSKK